MAAKLASDLFIAPKGTAEIRMTFRLVKSSVQPQAQPVSANFAHKKKRLVCTSLWEG